MLRSYLFRVNKVNKVKKHFTQTQAYTVLRIGAFFKLNQLIHTASGLNRVKVLAFFWGGPHYSESSLYCAEDWNIWELNLLIHLDPVLMII